MVGCENTGEETPDAGWSGFESLELFMKCLMNINFLVVSEGGATLIGSSEMMISVTQ